MKKIYFDPEKDGFYGVYYPCPQESRTAVIAMLGDSVDDRLAVSGVKWLHRLGCNVMAMAPAPKNYSHHNYPLERFGAAIEWLQKNNNRKIAIEGASTTGMLSLVAASYYPQITLTMAFSPSDFIMEGFYQEKGVERPGNGESTVSWQGKPLPYLPYAYRHPQYWQEIQKESKEGKNFVASRKMFDTSEKLHPVTEEEKIKVENTKGKVVFVGAEDDCLWDTCKYIRRMRARLEQLPHECRDEYLLYQHGTHFVFPESMLKTAIPVLADGLVKICFKAARDYPKECKATRINIDKNITRIIRDWKNA